jgi:integration host factor subunit alpha
MTASSWAFAPWTGFEMPRSAPGKVIGRAALARVVRSNTGGTLEHAKLVLEQILDVVIAELATGTSVRFHSFGTFDIRHKAENTIRHPVSGEETQVPARRTVVFRPSPLVLARLNSKQ